jgi:serine/threonine protein kinase/tetratricopeptide (TPR) repeat protein
MTQEDSIFGAEPDDLKRLVRFGLEPDDTGGDESTTPPTASVDELMERPGARIGRYKLLRVLGEGGMGVVYLAQQDKPVTRQVALKVIKPGMDSKRVMARFEAEEQALAMMEHPHVARVYDAGLTGSGRPYFVMEYVKGIPITEHCDKYKLTIEERLHLFLRVCEAVQHAHQKGIIHRDLKPSNILVSIDGDKSVPKVIDFGVARAVSLQLTEKTFYTEQGQLIGTPEYMSPEQADLNNQDIDTRTDIYSLGVVLYRLLSGIPPFDPQTLQASGIEHMRKVICEEEPKTPSTRLSKTSVEESMESARQRSTSVRVLLRRLHGDLDWITLKAMEKNRNRRYGSAGELAADIQRHLNHEAVLAGPPSTIYKIEKFVRRNRALVTGAASVIVVLIAGIVVSTIFAIKAEQRRTESEAVSSFLQNRVLGSLNLWNVKGEEITVRSVLDATSEGLSSELGDQPLVEASVRHTIANAYTFLGWYQPAEEHALRALAINQAELGKEHVDTLCSLLQVGWVYMYQNRCQEAEPFLSEALKGFQTALSEESFTRLVCVSSLGWIKLLQGRLAESERLFQENLDTIRKRLGPEDGFIPNSLNGLGCAHIFQGELQKAEELLNQALRLSRRIRGERDVDTHFIKLHLGALYRQQGRLDQAEKLLEEALEDRFRFLGEKHPQTLAAASFLGWLYLDQGRYNQAEELLSEVLETDQQILGREDIGRLYSMLGLGTLRLIQGQYDQAEAFLSGALDTGYLNMGEESWIGIRDIEIFAKQLSAQGKHEKAEELYSRLSVICRDTLGEDHLCTLAWIHKLGVFLQEHHRYEEAEPILLKAVEGRRLKLGDTHPHTIESWNNLIDLYEAWNKLEQAEKWRSKLPS